MYQAPTQKSTLSPKLHYTVLCLLCGLFFLLASCGSSGGSSQDSNSNSSAPTPTPTQVVTPTPSAPVISAPQLTYKGHTGPVIGVAWSPGGKHLASCGNDGTVQVWDAATGQTLLQYRGHNDIVFKVAWSPDGTMIASAKR